MNMESILKNKAGNLNMLYDVVILIAVIILISVLVFQVNSSSREDLVADAIAANGGNTATCNASSGIIYGCSAAVNATLDADTAVAKIPANLKLLAIAVVFGAVLFVIIRVLPRSSGTSF